MQYIYGKLLRSDSRRKSLAFQKSYLLTIIAGFQRLEENTLAFLTQLTVPEQNYVHRNQGEFSHRNPKWKFRSAVLLIISIFRMKWLIRRWRTGKRMGNCIEL